MKLFTLIPILLSVTFASAGEPVFHYTLGMPVPQTHYYEVELQFQNTDRDSSVDLILPAWRPGRYTILNFANGIEDFSAEGDGKTVPWRKTDKSTWHVGTNGSRDIRLTYKVYANEFSMRTRGLNDLHGFVDGSSVFIYSEKNRKLPITLTVNPYRNWHVTTGLESTDGRTFAAPNYDYFIDCPLEIGTQEDFPFTVDGTPHLLSIYGAGNWNADTLVRDISKIVKAEKDFWGAFPYKRYVFLLECLSNGGGGTEHINSTIMQSSPYGFKNPDSYNGFLSGLVAHEYFHTWNVKQLRPRNIDPYDFTKENYTEELWVAEGLTSYYADVISVRAGITPASKFVDHLGSVISSDRQRPGNNVESVADASFNAWIGGTTHWYNSESDFYERGGAVSAFLDLEIRRRSANSVSLDDVMREMYKRFPLTAGGYTLADLRNVAGELSGSDFTQFFGDFIYGTKPFPWEKQMAVAGLEVASTDSVPKPWIGVSFYDDGGRTRVNRIVAGSPAYSSGLDENDEVLALNDLRIRSGSFGDRIGEMKPGDKVTLTVFQNDRLRNIQITLGSAKNNFKVSRMKNPTELQKAIFESWLRTKW